LVGGEGEFGFALGAVRGAADAEFIVIGGDGDTVGGEGCAEGSGEAGGEVAAEGGGGEEDDFGL